MNTFNSSEDEVGLGSKSLYPSESTLRLPFFQASIVPTRLWNFWREICHVALGKHFQTYVSIWSGFLFLWSGRICLHRQGSVALRFVHDGVTMDESKHGGFLFSCCGR